MCVRKIPINLMLQSYCALNIHSKMPRPLSLETVYEDRDEDNMQRERHKATDLNLRQTKINRDGRPKRRRD